MQLGDRPVLHALVYRQHARQAAMRRLNVLQALQRRVVKARVVPDDVLEEDSAGLVALHAVCSPGAVLLNPRQCQLVP